ncbi:cysteine-rich receptor-like protein kinase 44 [Silene latifolia]|uniref:cysteine-rich receptor-like protein kinase 44 n=1 Tax=Silene latifolia TaxID=37657 RepID=UPI003D76F5DE
MYGEWINPFQCPRRASLGWESRFRIIIGVSKAVLYLHEDSRFKIIHRDLKPSNILLDHQLNPKVSDLGLARLFNDDQSQSDTNGIVGTPGYMAPEYARQGKISAKFDVYSLGIVILEIVSGQRNGFSDQQSDEEGCKSTKMETYFHRSLLEYKEEVKGGMIVSELHFISDGLLYSKYKIDDIPSDL